MTSAVAPALAHQQTGAPRATADVVADGTTQDAPRQVSQATEHPATLSDAAVTTLNEGGDDEPLGNETLGNGSIPENATTTQVTLVTGQTVTVVETENRTRYRTSADARMQKISTPNATYVFPAGVDFQTFDRNLFNVDFLVEQNLTDAEADSIPVIVSETEQGGYTAFDSEDASVLDSVAGTQKGATLESIDAVAGSVSKSDANAAYRDLAADDRVGQVTLDVKYRVALEQEGDAVSAPSARDTYGVSGNNVKVAVLDTGINESHPAIDREVDEKDFTGEGTTRDVQGHGTHVAGIIASDNETYTGMAPNASLMDLRVLDSYGYGSTSEIIEGMEYATKHDADIISMSLGGPATSARSNDLYKEAVNAAVDNGTLVVVAAGNSYLYGTIGSPGIHKGALTVGASNATSGDVARLSSRGPTPYGHYLKPNVVAPGVDVMSADHDGSDFVAKSGTSMATPAVSGIAALVLEKHPTWSPERVKSVLTTTADPLANESEGAYAQGTGQVNATDAVGTNVAVSPGTLDFGTYSSNTTATRNISVTNLGDTERTFSVSASAANLTGEETADVTLSQNSVTVGAGNTAQVEIEVNTSTPHGFYSGHVSFDDQTDGETYTAAFGFVRANRVTINKNGAGGTSTDGDFVWLFADQNSLYRPSGTYDVTQIDGSSVTFSVAVNGDYHVFTHGTYEDNGTPVVMTDTFSVPNTTTRTLDEQETVAYKLDTSAIEAESGSLDTRAVEVNYMKWAEDAYGVEVPYIAGLTTGADGTTVRFLPDENLNATVERVLVPSASAGTSDNFTGSDVYHLIHSTEGVTDDRTTAVEPDDLAQKEMTYFRNQRSGSYDVSLTAVGNTWEEFYKFLSGHVVEVTDGIGDRRGQSIYVNQNVSLHGVSATSEEGAAESWNLSNPFFGYTAGHDPGEYFEREINEHPYVGDLEWDFDPGLLDSYSAVSQVEQNRHIFDDSHNDTATLRLNGSVVSKTNTTTGALSDGTDWELDPQTDVELSVVGRNGATSLSTRTVTTYETTYVPDEDVTPPSVRMVNVGGLTVNNTAGSTVSVLFAVDGDTSSASAHLATDASATPFESDAGSWQSMSVEKVYDTWYTNVYRAEIDVNEAFGQHAGPVDLAIEATDGNGNTVESTTLDAFRVDAKKPTVTFTAAGATETPTEVNHTIRTNETLSVEFETDGTPGRTEAAATFLSADFTNFRTWDSPTRTDSGTWTAQMNLSDLPDDGNYTLNAVALDEFWNVKVKDPSVTVVLDRNAPGLGATVEQVNETTGRVTVTSNETLSSAPEATIEKPTGNNEEITLQRNTSADGYVWNETFSLAGDGNYSVTANGTDLAGNGGTTASTTEIETLNVTERNVTVVLEKSGLFIEFRTNETGFNSTVSVTESRSALAPLSRNFAGLNFLNGELGKNLTKHLDNATIGIPVNDSSLPPGIENKQVRISYYNESAGTWELLDTTVEERTIKNETRTYWVTDVTHFSTYGAVVDDEQAPSLDAKSPDGETFDVGTNQTRVTFNYTDSISGVNASAVELYFDGQRVTDEDVTNVTGAYATYNATELSSGDYTATVRLEDEAGNAKNYTTSFTIESESSGGGGGGAASGGGGGGADVPPPVVQVELTELTDTYAEAAVTNARASGPGYVSFDGGLTAGDATVQKLKVVPESRDAESKFYVEAQTSGSAPSGVAAFDGADETLGYLTVTPTYISDSELKTVGVTFEVDAGTVDSPENVALYRYDGSTWSKVQTKVADQNGGTYRFTGSADATGTFAIGTTAASFEVTEASLGSSSVAPDEEVTVSATVENVGSGAGTYTAELTVDGEVVATKQVTLAAGEQTTVEFTRTLAEGEHVVAVGSTEAGTLAVGSGAGTTEEGAIDDEENQQTKQDGKDSDSSSGIPGFGVPAALAAFAVAALLARRRES